MQSLALDSSDKELPEFVVSTGLIAKSLDLLLSKSTGRYNKKYVLFSNCCKENQVKSLKEELLLVLKSTRKLEKI